MTVQIAGVASTNFGKHPESSSRELFSEAAASAFADAGTGPADVEAVYVGNFMGDLIEDQGHMGALLADAAGARDAASVRIESACASSGAAVRQATLAIEAGAYDVVLVGGTEMMYSAGTKRITDALANAADNEYENQVGLTFPGIYAMMARRYLREYDASHEDLAAVAVKNHHFGVDNPIAQFREDISVADVLEANPVATPLGLLDCCPISDGASAMVLVSDDVAHERDLDAPVTVRGSGQSSDSVALQDRPDVARTAAAERAAHEAYDRADVGPDEVDVAEVHDCFTIAEVLAIESLGFYERGAGASAAADGETDLDGAIPVNTSGGLLAKGHPVGVTGVEQLVELTKQLEGRHPNQVADANVAVAHNVGGSGASAVVTVLGRGA
ncbi:MAG: thiolase domain-containing protein [Haloarculaceae archaeon]